MITIVTTGFRPLLSNYTTLRVSSLGCNHCCYHEIICIFTSYYFSYRVVITQYCALLLPSYSTIITLSLSWAVSLVPKKLKLFKYIKKICNRFIVIRIIKRRTKTQWVKANICLTCESESVMKRPPLTCDRHRCPAAQHWRDPIDVDTEVHAGVLLGGSGDFQQTEPALNSRSKPRSGTETAHLPDMEPCHSRAAMCFTSPSDVTFEADLWPWHHSHTRRRLNQVYSSCDCKYRDFITAQIHSAANAKASKQVSSFFRLSGLK